MNNYSESNEEVTTKTKINDDSKPHLTMEIGMHIVLTGMTFCESFIKIYVASRY